MRLRMLLLLVLLAGCNGSQPDAIVTVTCGDRHFDPDRGRWVVDWHEPMSLDVYGDDWRSISGFASYSNRRVCDFDVELFRSHTSTIAP